MTRVEKRLLAPARRRCIPSTGFGWIDRRLLRDRFLDRLGSDDLLLYLFLVVVADKDGISYWGDRSIAARLRLDERDLSRARAALEREDLILYRAPLYQVLSLPAAPAESRPKDRPGPTEPPRTAGEPTALSDILRRIL